MNFFFFEFTCKQNKHILVLPYIIFTWAVFVLLVVVLVILAVEIDKRHTKTDYGQKWKNDDAMTIVMYTFITGLYIVSFLNSGSLLANNTERSLKKLTLSFLSVIHFFCTCVVHRLYLFMRRDTQFLPTINRQVNATYSKRETNVQT